MFYISAVDNWPLWSNADYTLANLLQVVDLPAIDLPSLMPDQDRMILAASFFNPSIALDTTLNQKGRDVICIYVAIGPEGLHRGRCGGEAAAARGYGLHANTLEPASMIYLSPYSGAAMGEYFMYQGRDVLIVYDDLSKQAVACRELSLLLHR